MAVRRWLTLASLVLVFSILLRRFFFPRPCKSSDTAWFPAVAPGNHSSFNLHSFYVPSQDGTRLAVDVYLPSWWRSEHAGLPTILHFTRYNRAYRVKWPFSLFFGKQLNSRTGKWVEAFIPRGYAVVTVDVRGTGASYGHRPIDFQPREISDYPDVLNWVLKQKWCNRRIGTGGISYDGMVGLLLAAQGKGTVQAVAHLFSPDDIYEEIAASGGVACLGFARDYVSLTTSLEHNVPINVWLPWRVWFFANFVIDGSAPVIGHEEEFQNAIKEHAKNWNGTEFLQKLQFKDDDIKEVDGRPYSAMTIDIDAEIAQQLFDNNVAVYNYGGYFDSATTRSALNLHHQLESGGKTKLTIGPWTHGGRQNSSPFSPSSDVCFDFQADIVRFFDFYLKSEKSGIEMEESVHYFTMGEEQWKTSDQWPPSNVTYKSLYFVDEYQLSEVNGLVEAMDKYTVDYSTTSGVISRWNLVYHLFLESVTYPNRAQQHTRTLSYTSHPLTRPLTITGSVTVRLNVESVKSRDLVLFAYLEDVDINNSKVMYVTEGALRASHRCINESQNAACERSFKRSEWRPLDGIERVEMYLEPVSYQFGVGHGLRVSLAGADTDNFDHDTGRFDLPLPEQWHVHRGGRYDSQLVLPVEG